MRTKRVESMATIWSNPQAISLDGPLQMECVRRILPSFILFWKTYGDRNAPECLFWYISRYFPKLVFLLAFAFGWSTRER
ncbi:hypothetical protein CPC08DRAFT_209374 [Agrocybe pediades]|nr:hypothetical protein CPC08DRAFT_209374 [Agrocybe pediades]